MSTPRHPLSLADLDLLETDSLFDLLASLDNSNQHLKQSNGELRAEGDAELEAFAKENDDLIRRQEETRSRAKQILQRRTGVSLDQNPHYAASEAPAQSIGQSADAERPAEQNGLYL